MNITIYVDEYFFNKDEIEALFNLLKSEKDKLNFINVSVEILDSFVKEDLNSCCGSVDEDVGNNNIYCSAGKPSTNANDIKNTLDFNNIKSTVDSDDIGDKILDTNKVMIENKTINGVTSMSLFNAGQNNNLGRISKMPNTFFRISKVDNNFLVRYLDFNLIFNENNILEELKSFIANIMGYRVSILTGLTVRGSDGKKMKPEIKIYLKGSSSIVVPEYLEFIKTIENNDFTNNMSFKELNVFTESEILNCILQNTNIIFKSGKSIFDLKMSSGVITMNASVNNIPVIIDFLFKFTHKNEITKIVNSRNYHFTKSLDSILSGNCTTLEVKRFFKQISRETKANVFEYLAEVVENCPRFYDERENFIKNLSNYLDENAASVNISKNGYLDIKKRRIIKRNGSKSLIKLSKLDRK